MGQCVKHMKLLITDLCATSLSSDTKHSVVLAKADSDRLGNQSMRYSVRYHRKGHNSVRAAKFKTWSSGRREMALYASVC